MMHLFELSSLLSLIKPFKSLAFFPLAILNLALAREVETKSVLLPIHPITVVLATVRPGEDTVSLFLIVEVLALVLPTVGPREDATAVHLVIFPLTIVLASIRPGVDTVAVDVILEELAGVRRAVSPEDLTSAVFLSIPVLALVACIIRPDLLAVAMLLILEPVALVARSVRVVVVSETMCLIVLPFTAVDVAIGVDQPATPIGLVYSPVAFIEGTVYPDLDSLPILAAHVVPLSLILRTIVQSEHRSHHAHLSIIGWPRLEVEWLQRVSNLHDQLPCLKLLLVGLRVSRRLERRVLRLKAVLFLDGATRDDTFEVALHGNHSVVLALLWVEIASLAPHTLRFLSVKLYIVRLRAATSLSHLACFSDTQINNEKY